MLKKKKKLYLYSNQGDCTVYSSITAITATYESIVNVRLQIIQGRMQ